jgi:hypothetical protein
VQLDQLPQHGRRHELDSLKIEQQLAVARGLESHLLELAPDLVDDDLIENRSLLEVHDQNFAGVFENDIRVLKRFGHAVDLSLLKVTLENQPQGLDLERIESTAVTG